MNINVNTVSSTNFFDRKPIIKKNETNENMDLSFRDNLLISFGSTKNLKNISLINHELLPQNKIKAEKLTSLFENGTTKIDYSYAEHLDDGRGITAGRAGFTTGTGDLYEVVKEYCKIKPKNPLKKYLPELEKLASISSSNVNNLKGLIKDWHLASKDKVFRNTQDSVVDKMYYKPAMEHCKTLGLNLELSKAVFYDTIIQHGDGNDLDSLNAIITNTNNRFGHSPKDVNEEKKWIKVFIEERRKILANANDPETRKVWSESVGRCDAFIDILNQNNFNFDKSIKINTKEYNIEIN
ncbi:MAG: chitosanase [Candidatus Sericytochromatia bacterium]